MASSGDGLCSIPRWFWGMEEVALVAGWNWTVAAQAVAGEVWWRRRAAACSGESWLWEAEAVNRGTMAMRMRRKRGRR